MLGKGMFARNSYMTAAIAAGSLLLSATAGAAQAQTNGSLNGLSSDSLNNSMNGPTSRHSQIIATSTPVNYQTLYVDPTLGNDSAGGVEDQPLQTVTHALEIAVPNTVIVLAPGRYTQSSGEVFPLQLKSGVTIQGTPGVRDRTAIIEGGGNFESPLRSQQNAAIIAADRAGIAQVAISNPNGYGVWIESASPTILESAFVGNRQTGIYVTDGSPRVQGSYFSGNQVAGLIVFGDSSANIQSNTFDRTGDAIRVVDGATPEIVGNRMTNNEAGLVLIGNARPLLRDNQSVGNRRNEVVEVSTADQPSIQPPIQPVTQLAVNRTSEPVASQPAVSRALVSESDISESDISESDISESDISESDISQSGASELIARGPIVNRSVGGSLLNDDEPAAVVAEESPEADVAEAEEADTEQARHEPEAGAPGSALAALRSGLPSDHSSNLSAERSADRDLSSEADEGSASDLELASRAVTDGNPDSPVSRPRNRRPERDGEAFQGNRNPEPEERSAPPANNNRLAVPSSSIPIGDSSGSIFFAPPGNVSSRGLPAPTSRAQSLGLYYRVFVEASNTSVQDEVRSVVPDAFRTSFEGETVMQVGAFPTEDEAEDRKQLLEDHDLDARVEYIR
jgi:hypothetical protein